MRTLLPDDLVKERNRANARVVFDHQAWQSHRSATRYGRHISGLLSSRTVFGLMRPLLYVVGVATAVCAFEAMRAGGIFPVGMPGLPQVSMHLFTLTSFCLSLLLVFRTNASYERWDGARKMWGLMLNRSRDIVRQGLTHISPDKYELRAMLCRWVPAFSRTLMCHLRSDKDIRQELDGVLLPEEVDQVVMATHRPNYVLQVLSEIVKTARVRTAVTMKMEENLTTFEDVLGGCERILRTPVPLSYTRHTSRSLMIWLTLLPFGLFSTCGLATIPICAIIGLVLLGIEEIGVAIEEPFSILALEAISNTALTNIRELQATNTGSAPGGLRPDPAHLSAGQVVGRATARPGLPVRPAVVRRPLVPVPVPAPAPAAAAAAAGAVRPGASLEEELAAVKAAGGFLAAASPASASPLPADDTGVGRVKQGEYTYKVYPAVRPLGAFAARAYRAGAPRSGGGLTSPAGGRRGAGGKGAR